MLVSHVAVITSWVIGWLPCRRWLLAIATLPHHYALPVINTLMLAIGADGQRAGAALMVMFITHNAAGNNNKELASLAPHTLPLGLIY